MIALGVEESLTVNLCTQGGGGPNKTTNLEELERMKLRMSQWHKYVSYSRASMSSHCSICWLQRDSQGTRGGEDVAE